MILAEGYCNGDEYIPEIVDDPWANLQRVARVLGRSTALRIVPYRHQPPSFIPYSPE